MYEINELSQRLKEVSEELNEKSDALLVIFRDVEHRLTSINLGVQTWVKLPIEGEEIFLGYGRLPKDERRDKAQWGLRVKNGATPGGVERTWTIFDAPRRFRIIAVDALPDLLRALFDEAKKISNSLDKANKVGNEFNRIMMK